MPRDSKTGQFLPAAGPDLPVYSVFSSDLALREALDHIEALLELLAGMNGNHEIIVAWCSRCDNTVLHGPEACRCPCHPAREFLRRTKAEL